MHKVVIVEDETSILELVQMNLELEGYAVETYSKGDVVLENISSVVNSSLIILDVMLPGNSGIEIAKKVREQSDVPILFLSAKGTTKDKIEGLKSGGNDYLAKPFELEELLLRVNILSGKKQSEKQQIATIGSLTVDFKTYLVANSKNEEITSLSKKEIELLMLFVERDGEVISRDEILDKIWGTDKYPTSRTIDNFILSFRKLFEEDPKKPQFFHSVRGVGYRFTQK